MAVDAVADRRRRANGEGADAADAASEAVAQK
jgi:hypothetical protein